MNANIWMINRLNALDESECVNILLAFYCQLPDRGCVLDDVGYSIQRYSRNISLYNGGHEILSVYVNLLKVSYSNKRFGDTDIYPVWLSRQLKINSLNV